MMLDLPIASVPPHPKVGRLPANVAIAELAK